MRQYNWIQKRGCGNLTDYAFVYGVLKPEGDTRDEYIIGKEFRPKTTKCR